MAGVKRGWRGQIKFERKADQRSPRTSRSNLTLPHSLLFVRRPHRLSNNHPTERISQFIDYHLKPIVCTVSSYVKDTTDFLNKLAKFNRLPDNAILGTLDVTSLYTNIPHSEGIAACRFSFKDKRIPIETIILNTNNFTFNGRRYLQKHGTTTGTKMALSFANLFLANFEYDALRNAPYLPHTWLRFLEDIFFIWTKGSDKLKLFVESTIIICAPLSNSLVHIPVPMSHSLMLWPWFHSTMVL